MKRAFACWMLLAACGGGAEGELRIQLSGEEAAQVGFPVGDIEFADGWSIAFDHLLVSVTEVHLRAADGDDAFVMADPIVVDLTEGEPEGWHFQGVPARRWDRVSYQIAPATADARAVGTIDPDAMAAMIAGGHSAVVEGSATRGGETVTFAWAFTVSIENSLCENGFDGTEGVVIREGGVTDAQLTVHYDHLFFDSYATDEPALRFDPMAAVAGEDGVLTLEELATQNLVDMRDADGEPLQADGAPLTYDPGDLVIERNDLRAYLVGALTTVGHFNGEGHCDYRRTDS